MPASRIARAITLAPRSCPSSPGFAITTRILCISSQFSVPSFQFSRLSCRSSFVVRHSEHGLLFPLSPYLAQDVAHLTKRGVGTHGIEDRGHEIVRACSGRPNPLEGSRHGGLVPRRPNVLQAGRLRITRGFID